MYLGIEIGGTKLQVGLGRGDGVLLGLWRGRVEASAGAAGIQAQLMTAVPELLARSGIERASLRGIGIGFGGPVDDANQCVIRSHQIDGWDNFPLAQWIGDMLGLPAVLGNDADVAGLGEALYGAGRDLSPIFYITIGSGIGGGLIIEGAIYRGSGRGAAEIGHLRIHGTILEKLASGWALGRIAQDSVKKEGWHRAAALKILASGDSERIEGVHVGAAAAKGDPLAQDILASAWSHLAEGITHVIALLCPRRIIIGGGVSLLGEELLFEPLRRAVAERVFKPFADCYDIVPAALGEQVVVHGAIGLAAKPSLASHSAPYAPLATGASCVEFF